MYIRGTPLFLLLFSFFLITDKLIEAEIELQAGVNYNPLRIKQTAINFPLIALLRARERERKRPMEQVNRFDIIMRYITSHKRGRTSLFSSLFFPFFFNPIGYYGTRVLVLFSRFAQ